MKIKVIGKVQGVFFRASTQKKAKELGVQGWVSNESDGSVLIEAEAHEEILNQFIKWCGKGPEWSVVNDVIITKIAEIRNYETFEIRR